MKEQFLTQLGIPGIPAVVEEMKSFNYRNWTLLTGANLHFQQISTAQSIEIINEAKSNGGFNYV